jgi:hypothetical protein
MAERWCNRFCPSSLFFCHDGSAFLAQSLLPPARYSVAAKSLHVAHFRRALDLSALVVRILSAGIAAGIGPVGKHPGGLHSGPGVCQRRARIETESRSVRGGLFVPVHCQHARHRARRQEGNDSRRRPVLWERQPRPMCSLPKSQPASLEQPARNIKPGILFRPAHLFQQGIGNCQRHRHTFRQEPRIHLGPRPLCSTTLQACGKLAG